LYVNQQPKNKNHDYENHHFGNVKTAVKTNKKKKHINVPGNDSKSNGAQMKPVDSLPNKQIKPKIAKKPTNL